MNEAEKRSVHTDALATLGTIIDAEQHRDAIHIAVEPVRAAEWLNPGQHVGFVQGGFGRCVDTVGIVDPFLEHSVEEGQYFWLLVYPRQISSLRHVWAHPKFDNPPQVSDQKARSETWIRNWIDSLDTDISYEVIVQTALSGDGEMYFGDEIYGAIPDEFWDHLEIVSGKKFTKRATYFSCAC